MGIDVNLLEMAMQDKKKRMIMNQNILIDDQIVREDSSSSSDNEEVLRPKEKNYFSRSKSQGTLKTSSVPTSSQITTKPGTSSQQKRPTMIAAIEHE
jgi:hypothetical protein